MYKMLSSLTGGGLNRSSPVSPQPPLPPIQPFFKDAYSTANAPNWADNSTIKPTTAGLLQTPSMSRTQSPSLSHSNSPFPSSPSPTFMSDAFKNELVSQQRRIISNRLSDKLTIDEKLDTKKRSNSANNSLLDERQQNLNKVNKQLEDKFKSLQQAVASQQFPDIPGKLLLPQSTLARNGYQNFGENESIHSSFQANQSEFASLTRPSPTKIDYDSEFDDTDSIDDNSRQQEYSNGNGQRALTRQATLSPSFSSIYELGHSPNSPPSKLTPSNGNSRSYRDICQSPEYKSLELLTEKLDKEIASLESFTTRQTLV